MLDHVMPRAGIVPSGHAARFSDRGSAVLPGFRIPYRPAS